MSDDILFPMTSDGYIAAKKYLKEMGRYGEFLVNLTSTDGYSLVAFANSVYRENMI